MEPLLEAGDEPAGVPEVDRFDDSGESGEPSLGLSSAKADRGLKFMLQTKIMLSANQRMAVPMVILVKTSPARVPKALEPPMPPKAPARPPPFPR